MKIAFSSALTLALSFVALNSLAGELKPVKQGSRAETVARNANDVYSVQYLKLAGKTYKFVSMSSELSGDSSSTTMLLVGDEVGGEAGYENAFVITPDDHFISMRSAKLNGSHIAVTLYKLSGKYVTKQLRYDDKAQVLKMK